MSVLSYTKKILGFSLSGYVFNYSNYSNYSNFFFFMLYFLLVRITINRNNPRHNLLSSQEEEKGLSCRTIINLWRKQNITKQKKQNKTKPNLPWKVCIYYSFILLLPLVGSAGLHVRASSL